MQCLPDQTFAFLFDFWIGVGAPHMIDYFPLFCFILSLLDLPEIALLFFQWCPCPVSLSTLCSVLGGHFGCWNRKYWDNWQVFPDGVFCQVWKNLVLKY
jgi:hypothetical protein